MCDCFEGGPTEISIPGRVYLAGRPLEPLITYSCKKKKCSHPSSMKSAHKISKFLHSLEMCKRYTKKVRDVLFFFQCNVSHTVKNKFVHKTNTILGKYYWWFLTSTERNTTPIYCLINMKFVSYIPPFCYLYVIIINSLKVLCSRDAKIREFKLEHFI